MPLSSLSGLSLSAIREALFHSSTFDATGAFTRQDKLTTLHGSSLKYAWDFPAPATNTAPITRMGTHSIIAEATYDGPLEANKRLIEELKETWYWSCENLLKSRYLSSCVTQQPEKNKWT